jgi:two-component system, sensor histidine kinase and response regulator
VAMSASALDSDRDHCLSVGMDDHLPKPLYPDALCAMLHRWVGADAAGERTA